VVTTTTTTTTTVPPAPSPAEGVVTFVLAQRGKPYVYGAAGPGAFDCSGLVLAAYRGVGIVLPHASRWQARHGRSVDWRRRPIRPGDMVFTRGGDPVVDLGHVGVAVSATAWVSAPHAGAVVHRTAIPFGAVQEVRRLVDR
jgi:cell wall-associated NlpC family hydrolase